MRELFNLANAAVIIACLYFLINVIGFWAKAGIILILLFAICTWGIHTYPKKSIELANEETESRIRLNNSNAAFTTANALLLREQAIWNQNKRSK
jgi:ABC-type protease/lipase transport system fused ATPase/permease subunit